MSAPPSYLYPVLGEVVPPEILTCRALAGLRNGAKDKDDFVSTIIKMVFKVNAEPVASQIDFPVVSC